jgi:hypothetical protein
MIAPRTQGPWSRKTGSNGKKWVLTARRFHVGLVPHIALIIHARKYAEKLHRSEGPVLPVRWSPSFSSALKGPLTPAARWFNPTQSAHYPCEEIRRETPPARRAGSTSPGRKAWVRWSPSCSSALKGPFTPAARWFNPTQSAHYPCEGIRRETPPARRAGSTSPGRKAWVSKMVAIMFLGPERAVNPCSTLVSSHIERSLSRRERRETPLHRPEGPVLPAQAERPG